VTDDRDAAVRLRACELLRELRQRLGEASIPRPILEGGFDFEGVRVPLIGPVPTSKLFGWPASMLQWHR